ncbi:3-beta-hydroxycholanate 3-dehydrogenase (NADP(+)) [Paraburkholderia aspalathi]|jgi:dihydroxycyclohexadiene carboxylate dehydrogenase|uniref:3-beta-hydroxycholanate 3-dehydrogenase (NADP(+)) n=1 Tax=Paraburkholderia aspalathi TaxID=1324617 RepID=A0ABN7M5D0_9BURK|nr:benzoate diol dehydrogenase BenD [Paraburkholderia aspalathi]MBK3820780.1 1,6-dihydroxycyclohexa-2,4-diene-1-carboxylate dehydrogenase [Paraburkholderia aspalathi]MBK3835428.1 1,6-dihydroxycyclohexa-2,4-diene-1-carboxylate dehydrogenase [Paraburkholderia aspalathi]MBK3862338.1 1,6-dihydroxycyclohexa-2,4-diene-1-carboxylate dehydrogenase [Paraburkholderia aspalathi]CAE6745482.1 3-beta-hydroxycholanate 3-dehydrogenase (NADP(+)) [Paraburkholderia aspalathi]CAE6786273.1 3-beta-hydroxycholanate 
MSTQRFAGKVMVVTGAAQGIGRAVALRAAAEGGKVLFVDRAEFVSEVAAEASGAETAGFVADLETYEGAASAMAFAVSNFGGIDILINGVGGAIRMRPFAEFEPEQIDAEIRRSLMPTLYACHAVLPHLLKRNGGTIVNVSSNATRGIRRVPYSAAKGGVNAITQSLAMEYAEHNIRVVATAPGGTDAPPRRVPRNTAGDSEREKVWMSDAVKQVTESTFFKRYGSIDEQVAPILFLASDEASYITGTVLPVAGGDTG